MSCEPLCWALWVVHLPEINTLVCLQFGLAVVEWTNVLSRFLFRVPAQHSTNFPGLTRLLLLTDTLIFFISNCNVESSLNCLWYCLGVRFPMWQRIAREIPPRTWKFLVSTICIYNDYWSIIVDWEKLVRWQKIGWEINFQGKSSRIETLPGEIAKT